MTAALSTRPSIATLIARQDAATVRPGRIASVSSPGVDLVHEYDGFGRGPRDADQAAEWFALEAWDQLGDVFPLSIVVRDTVGGEQTFVAQLVPDPHAPGSSGKSIDLVEVMS